VNEAISRATHVLNPIAVWNLVFEDVDANVQRVGDDDRQAVERASCWPRAALEAGRLQEPRCFGPNVMPRGSAGWRQGNAGPGWVLRHSRAPEEISAKGDDLERLNAIVDFEAFRSDLARAVPRSDAARVAAFPSITSSCGRS